MALIQHLPAELMSEIFLHCMKSREFYDPYDIRPTRLDKTPLLVAKIDSRWRSIALSTPILWSSIALTIQPKYLKGDVLLAKSWMARSGKCPLTIYLAGNGDLKNTMQLMEVFLLRCERWHDVQLYLPSAVIRSLSEAKNRLPRLQRLYIGPMWPADVDIFENAPQLRCVYLAAGVAPSEFKFKWDQLRSCDTGLRSTESCLELFRLTPNLEECIVSPASVYLHNSHPSVELAHLRSMTIRNSPACFLDALLVPELREVFVHPSPGQWNVTPQLVSLLLRSSVQILSFHMKLPINYYRENMVQILQASHSLVELELRGYSSHYMDKSFFTLFAHHQDPEEPNSPLLVPALHTIRVDNMPPYFDIANFIAAVQSRMALHILKKVEIRLPSWIDAPSFDAETVSRLRQLRDEGFGISILYGGRNLIQTGDLWT